MAIDESKIAAFFSYSTNDPGRSKVVLGIVGAAKQRVLFRGDWYVVDAMEPHPGRFVHKKVESSLRQSDVLIAEVTGWSPNVMFEIGFARANRYPIILLCNRDSIDGRPFPADIRGMQYLPYTEEELDLGGLAGLRTRIDDQLQKVTQELQPGLISLRRGERRLQRKTDELAVSVDGREDPPLLRLLGGWLEKVVGELGDAGSRGFLVSPKYYPACFSKFWDKERHTAFAIADLSDQTEAMSVLVTSEANMAVSERILLVSGQQFFDQPKSGQPKLSTIYPLIRQHVEQTRLIDPNYRVLIARSDDVELPSVHPVPDSRSKDLLLISPDIVGGYLKLPDGQAYLRDDHSYLRVVESNKDFVKALNYYKIVRAAAFPFDMAWQVADDMRAAWLNHEKKVGLWIEGWSYDRRDPVYYELYDLHIRTWVPGYDEFILSAAARVVEVLLRLRVSAGNGPVNILEIGSGTGNLTLQLLGAIEQRRAASQMFGQLVAIDKALEMVSATEDAIQKTQFVDRVKVRRGFAFGDLSDEVTETAPFGIICGTLVLSHLLQSEVEERLEAVMTSCKELLAPGGSVVLADALVPDPAQRAILKARWKTAMVHHGLPPDRAEHFLEHNQEMLETVTEATLKVAAERHDFNLHIHDIPGFDSPFRTIVLERKC